MSERKISYSQAIREAMIHEMERDQDVIFLGQDISGGAGREKEAMIDTWGGSFGVSKGMASYLGTERVLDCPLSEAAYIGTAVAAATVGLRPIVELMFNDFIWLAGDQLFNNAAKLRYLSAGVLNCKLTVRTVIGGGLNAGMHHSQCLYSLATHIPGFKIVVPSTPYIAKGILIASIRDNDPVIVFEHKALYNSIGEVPEEDYVIPIGKAKVVQLGSDVTIIAISRMVDIALDAAAYLAKNGINAEVIDPITLSPLDEDTILNSIKKTGHLVVVDEANGRCSIAADIMAMVSDKAVDYIDGPLKMVAAPHTPVPFSPSLEKEYLPNVDNVIKSVFESLG